MRGKTKSVKRPGTIRYWAVLRSTFNGFTLIEILVGLTIVALLFGVGYASYRDFARRQILNSSYDKIRSSLSLAQQLALSGDKPAGCPANSVLSGYRVDFGQKKFYAECVGPGGTTLAQEKIIDIPPGIEISSSQSTILYKVLGQGTDQVSETTITITQTGTGSTINAILTQDGRLKK